jgi:biotin carboxylase
MISTGIVSCPSFPPPQVRSLRAAPPVFALGQLWFNANIRFMATDSVHVSTTDTLPLVAVGYGPRCVPVMQLTEAAAGLCELLWMIDGSLPEMREMTELLNRFGPVVDIAGLNVDQLLAELSPPYRPDAIVTYLDANMTTFARVAETFVLPFHTPTTALALTDKADQRRALHAAGLGGPAFVVIASDLAESELAGVAAEIGWPAVLKPRSAQGSRYTFFVPSEERLIELLGDLGTRRPDMVLESYLADDPSRSDGPYADYVSVESIVAAGTISHLALTGRFPLAENFRETGFFIPAALDARDEAAVLKLATSAIRALGVTTGCLHTEIKFTPDGAQVIEVNGRVGGGVPEMLARASGLKLVEMTLRLALGEPLQVKGPVATDRIGFRFFLQPPAVSATVASIEGIDAVSEYPGVDAITVHQGPGAVLDWKDGSRNHIMAVVGSSDDYEQLQDVNRLLHDEVTVTYADASLAE